MANNTLLVNNDILLGSHPIEIYLACDKLFAGEPWLEWEPETLLLQLRDDVDDLAEDKLRGVLKNEIKHLKTSEQKFP